MEYKTGRRSGHWHLEGKCTPPPMNILMAGAMSLFKQRQLQVWQDCNWVLWLKEFRLLQYPISSLLSSVHTATPSDCWTPSCLSYFIPAKEVTSCPTHGPQGHDCKSKTFWQNFTLLHPLKGCTTGIYIPLATGSTWYHCTTHGAWRPLLTELCKPLLRGWCRYWAGI